MKREQTMKANSMKFLTAILVLSGLMAAPAFAGGDAAAGAGKSTVCAACHGPAGNAPIMAEYPKLAGQPQDYIVNALRDYQKGNRKDPVMSAQAAALSPQDVLDLAAYFSSQPSSLVVKY
jgi:cytochrome c553